ncbi:MAG: glycosyltransferase family 2 protein [Candidatus Eisenbacteria bacterium]|nr:glycosyltransferase family 2 protein [Candidatus Eisenbacteria bacterium]
MHVSIVIPLLNEEASLGPLHEAITGAMAGVEGGWEVLYVDDGSTDGSLGVLRSLHEADPRAKVLSFGRNLGKSAALATGFAEAAGEIVVTMDADLQDDPREIPRLIATLDGGYDLVSGWKRRRMDPLSKRLPSKVFNAVVARLSGVRLHDMNCGLKAYRRSVVETIRVYGELHRFTPVLAHWAGFRVTEIEVTHHARAHGSSKFGAERFVRGFFDLLTVLFLRRYVARPLHLFGMMGGILFLGGFGIGVYLTVIKIMGEAIGRRPLLTLGILLMVVGVQFVSFGLLGEMIANLRSEGVSHPVRVRLAREDAKRDR